MRRVRSLLSLLPMLVGVISLAVTAGLWRHEQRTTQHALQADFDFSVRQTASRIEERMATYEQMLRGVQGLFRGVGRVDRDRFEGYVDTLLAGAGSAGIQFFTYAPLQRDGDGATSAELAYVAPATASNLTAIGNDPWADPVRRAAMLRAGDSGGVGITQRLPGLIDFETDPQAGFLMFLPVYAAGLPLTGVRERRSAIAGWVLTGIRLGDLMSSLYGEGTPGIRVRLHDGVELSPGSLVFDSHAVPGDEHAPGLEAIEYIGFAGHSWALQVSALPAFEARYGVDAARVIALAGIGLSLLLALLTRQLVSGRQRAHDVALAMTKELRVSEERYRRIVETADEGIWMTDAQGCTSFVNPKLAQMLGCPVDAMIGRRPAEFLDAPPAADTVPSGAALREVRFRRGDGALLWASMVTTPILDAQGLPGGSLAMVTDISGRKQSEATRVELEAQLRESQKMEAIGTLAGGIAHDFNNILASILGNVDLARDAAAADPVLRARLEQIGAASVRARSLVQQILAFSRRQPQHRVVQPLRPLIEESARLLRSILPALAELEVVLADAPMDVLADATQLQQVVVNLCTNAWHALGGRAGRVVLGLEARALDADVARRLGLQPGRHAHLWVSDTGCGMDEATRSRVFEPFFTTKPVGQGTGLGLSVVHGIVATHGGAIAVVSAPGQGSRFDLYFPLVAPPSAVAPALPPLPQSTHGDSGHVVYLDDDLVMLEMVHDLLERDGYRVTLFEDPAEALEALRARPDEIDLLVTDYNMPGLSGLDVARELARLRPGWPVIISSGYVSEELLAAAAQVGVHDVMQKEYTLEHLPGLVRRLLAERRTHPVHV